MVSGRKGMLGKTIEGDDGLTSKERKKEKAQKAKKKEGSDSLAGSMEPGYAGSSVGGGGGAGTAKAGWLSVGNAMNDFKEKPIKALVLANGVDVEKLVPFCFPSL